MLENWLRSQRFASTSVKDRCVSGEQKEPWRRNHKAWVPAVALLLALWPEASHLSPPPSRASVSHVCKMERLDWIIPNAACSQGPCNWVCIQILKIEPNNYESNTSHVGSWVFFGFCSQDLSVNAVISPTSLPILPPPPQTPPQICQPLRP